jgi:hypothetical protein
MQILKGSILKSVTVSKILESTKSYCIAYSEVVIPFLNAYHTDSNKYTIQEFKSHIQQVVDCKSKDPQYDYFILYTNNTEEELQGIIEFLDGKELDFNCRCILVTCR